MIFETGGTNGGVVVVAAAVAGATVVAVAKLVDSAAGTAVDFPETLVVDAFVVAPEVAAEVRTTTAGDVDSEAFLLDEQPAAEMPTVTTSTAKTGRRFRRRPVDAFPLAPVITTIECRRHGSQRILSNRWRIF